VDLEPVVDHDHLVDDQAEDGPFEFEVGISEPIAKLYRNLTGSRGMPDREISSGLPRAQFRLLVFYSQDPILERLLAGLEVGQIERYCKSRYPEHAHYRRLLFHQFPSQQAARSHQASQSDKR